MNRIFTYDAFDTTGVAETFTLKVNGLYDSDKDYLGDLDYEVLEGDITLLSDEQALDMEICISEQYIERWNDYMN